MKRPDLGEAYMVHEGLAEYDDRHNALPVVESTLPTKVIDDREVMRAVALVCNSLPYGELDDPSMLWLAPNSLGLRDTDAPKTATLVGSPRDIYSYDGHDIRDANNVFIGSGTSGANIEFVRVGDDEWEAVLNDPERKSTRYRNVFKHLGHDSLRDLTKKEIWDEGAEPYDLPDDIEQAA